MDWTKGPLSAGWRKLIQQIAGGLRPAPSPAPLQSQTVHIHWRYLLSTAHADCRYAEQLEVVSNVVILGPLLKQILVLETSPDTTIDDGDGKIKTTLL